MTTQDVCLSNLTHSARIALLMDIVKTDELKFIFTKNYIYRLAQAYTLQGRRLLKFSCANTWSEKFLVKLKLCMRKTESMLFSNQ